METDKKLIRQAEQIIKEAIAASYPKPGTGEASSLASPYFELMRRIEREKNEKALRRASKP